MQIVLKMRAHERRSARRFDEIAASVSTSASSTPSPQFVTNARSTMPEIGTKTVKSSHSATIANATHRHAPSGSAVWRARLALHRDELVGALQQPALQQHQRQRDRDDAHRDRRHQVIRRHAELVGELVQIGREHQVAFRIAEHQRQAEHFEAEEEHQHAA